VPSGAPLNRLDDARFNGNAARPVRHQPRGRDARGPDAAEGSAAAAMPGSTLQSIGLLGCRQRPRNERLGALRAAPLSRTRLSRTSRSSSQVMAQARTRFLNKAEAPCRNLRWEHRVQAAMKRRAGDDHS